nr:hypothetical protein GCM10020092_058190 [Actinoplanes digitatis]
MNSIGSQPGDRPSRRPVSHSDHGAYFDSQNASPLGRTCTKIALCRIETARSSHPRYSACTCSLGRPGRLGQSMFITVVSHMPRSSRAALTGTFPHRPGTPGPACAAATGPAPGGSYVAARTSPMPSTATPNSTAATIRTGRTPGRRMAPSVPGHRLRS